MSLNIDKIALDSDGQLTIPRGTTLPSSGMVEGDLFFKTDTDVLYVYNSSSWQAVGSSIFGSEFAETSSDAEASNNTTTYSNKIDYTTASLTSGRKYRIGVSFDGKTGNPGDQGEFNVVVDGTSVNTVENKDNYYQANSMVYYYTPGSTGTKVIRVQYRVKTGTTGTAYIKNARVEIWRVS